MWAGFDFRIGKHIVATPNGAFTVSTVMRRVAGQQWSKDLVKGICGSPSQPIPGMPGHKLQAFAKKFESEMPYRPVFMLAPPAAERKAPAV